MRTAYAILTALILCLPARPAHASERGTVIRAGDLYTQPFIDAAKAGPLTANQPVTVVERRGGWISVDAGGRRGWVRLLNVRLDPGAVGEPSRPAVQLRTGSTKQTVATGVKGLEEADIRNAAIDRAQLAQLDAQGADEAAARRQAADHTLPEAKVAYLKPGKGK